MQSDIENFLATKDEPLRSEMQQVREIILGVHPTIEETIKWKVPTFMYKGNIASFMNTKKLVSVMFHKGALIPDKQGLLEGEGKEARVARFYGLEDIEQKREALENVISQWIKMRDMA